MTKVVWGNFISRFDDTTMARCYQAGPLLIWVDDNPKNNETLMKYAQEHGIKVLQFTSTSSVVTWIKINIGMWHYYCPPCTSNIIYWVNASIFEALERIFYRQTHLGSLPNGVIRSFWLTCFSRREGSPFFAEHLLGHTSLDIHQWS